MGYYATITHAKIGFDWMTRFRVSKLPCLHNIQKLYSTYKVACTLVQHCDMLSFHLLDTADRLFVCTKIYLNMRRRLENVGSPRKANFNHSDHQNSQPWKKHVLWAAIHCDSCTRPGLMTGKKREHKSQTSKKLPLHGGTTDPQNL